MYSVFLFWHHNALWPITAGTCSGNLTLWPITAGTCSGNLTLWPITAGTCSGNLLSHTSSHLGYFPPRIFAHSPHYYCAWKYLRPYSYMLGLTKQSELTQVPCDRRPQLFGHVARSDALMDHSRALHTVTEPLKASSRPTLVWCCDDCQILVVKD